MKIAIVADYHNKTGVGKQNYQLYRSLKSLGIDVQIINLVSSQGFKKVPDYGFNIEASSFAGGVFYVFRKSLFEFLKSNDFDCVLLGHQGLAYLHSAVLKSGNVPILSIADLFALDGRYAPWYDVRYWVYNLFMLRGFDTFENVVFNSNFTKETYLEKVGRLPKRHAVIHIGANAPSATGTRDWAKEFGNRKVVLQVGSSDIRKNVGTFMRIAEKFVGHENVSFVRVGYTSKKYAESAPQNVTLLSGLSEEDLLSLYRYAKVFVFTSLAEGYGMPVVEARLADLPVVSSKVSDMASIFKNDEGSLFVDDPFSVDEYVPLLEKALDGGLVRILNEDVKALLGTDREAENYVSFFASLR